MGAIFAGYVGFHWHLPPGLHLLARACSPARSAARCGAASPGCLKATTGAHEVITTIMLNYIALYFLGYLLGVKGFQAPAVRPGDLQPRVNAVPAAALLGASLRVHAGLILARRSPRSSSGG